MATKANSAFMKPLQVSEELGAVVGKGPMPRSEVVKKLWAYIKKKWLARPEQQKEYQCRRKIKSCFRRQESCEYV